jgi:hypothetical protein
MVMEPLVETTRRFEGLASSIAVSRDRHAYLKT